ncbi:MAG: undecaprenyl-diphosphate phosphatase [Lentisphaerota bacterium]
MNFINTIVMGIVEGITEFLPVSSTGHLIITKSLLQFKINDAFEVFIQMGAILAVVLAYWPRFMGLLKWNQSEGFSGLKGVGFLALTSVPALLLGFLIHGFIKEKLFNNVTVAAGLAVGGLWILLAERFLKARNRTSLDEMTWKQALAIGFFQCFALWPGMSRSSSTILGAMLMGLDRKSATEYSFFAAVPVLLAAGFFDLLDNLDQLSSSDLGLFGLGFVVSFLSAWIAIQWLIRFVSRHNLMPFGWYRLVIAAVILIWMR